MEEKKRLGLAELRVGLFVIGASAVLAVAIFTIGSQVGLLEETFIAKTYLNNVSGLKPGDVVLLGGVEVGNVSSVHISKSGEMPSTRENERQLAAIQDLEAQIPLQQQVLDEAQQKLDEQQTRFRQIIQESGEASPPARHAAGEVKSARTLLEQERRNLDRLQEKLEQARNQLQNIVVYLEIKSDYRSWIREDSHISLGSIGLLGDKFIEISLGRSPRSPQVAEEKVEGLFGSSQQQVVLITGRPQTGFQELITGANDILTNFESLSETLQEIMGNFREGEGSVGKFFADTTFYDNLNDTVLRAQAAARSADSLLSDLDRGEGTIPSLIHRKELYDRINATASTLKKVVTRIEEGRGALGKFVNDPQLYDSAHRVMASIEEISHRINAGKGTLGKLSTDEKLYQDTREAIRQVTAFIQDVEAGKGTLGRLAKDQQLYENLNEVSSEMVKLLYDFRQNPRKFLTIKFELF